HAKQRGHGSRRPSQIVRTEPRRDDSNAGVSHFHADVHQQVVKELSLVYADDSDPEREMRAKLRRIDDRNRIQLAVVARYDSLYVEAVVDYRLEELGSLLSNLGASDSANQLLTLAAEHPAGDDFDPSTSLIESIH